MKMYSHEVMKQIKVKVTMDGDVAASVLNALTYAAENGVMDDLLYCDHARPGTIKFMEKLISELDVENRPER